MRRIGAVIGIEPGDVAEYVRLHREVWPEVLEVLRRANVTNYSIFLREGLLFSYLEYRGDDLALDMDRIAESEVTKRWWALTMPLQKTLRASPEEDWWAPMTEVFHLE